LSLLDALFCFSKVAQKQLPTHHWHDFLHEHRSAVYWHVLLN
jgi:hypothetical protein